MYQFLRTRYRFIRRKLNYRLAYVCDGCGKEIRDIRELRLLRGTFALPEEPTYHLHGKCEAHFKGTHRDTWRRIPLQSPEASWCL